MLFHSVRRKYSVCLKKLKHLEMKNTRLMIKILEMNFCWFNFSFTLISRNLITIATFYFLFRQPWKRNFNHLSKLFQG